jgi:hypothetical protein
MFTICVSPNRAVAKGGSTKGVTRTTGRKRKEYPGVKLAPQSEDEHEKKRMRPAGSFG